MNLLVFDSGIGGLGVVREIRRLQPDANITYLADNGFFPYGEKPDAVLLPHIIGLIGRAIEKLSPSAVVIACNTASTIALPALRATYGSPFIGCVPPIKPAAAASKAKHIGVLATAATVRRAYLSELIEKFAPGCAIHSLGTPTLAELAEQKFRGMAVDPAGAIAPLFAQPGAGSIDAIALGCTHYTFLLPEFEALYPNIAWFDPALPVARQTFTVTRQLTTSSAAQEAAAYFTGALPDFEIMQAKLAHYGFRKTVPGSAF
jgi:glutamate racemase